MSGKKNFKFYTNGMATIVLGQEEAQIRKEFGLKDNDKLKEVINIDFETRKEFYVEVLTWESLGSRSSSFELNDEMDIDSFTLRLIESIHVGGIKISIKLSDRDDCIITESDIAEGDVGEVIKFMNKVFYHIYKDNTMEIGHSVSF